jgi:hypothetical protein
MAQPIKYNTGSKTANCCIRKGNYDIGVVANYEYGPTSGSGFYAGYTIPSGGFVSYQNKASQGPSIYSIPTIDDIVNFGINLNLAGINAESPPEEVIEACWASSTIAFVNIDYPEIPRVNNCLLILDAGYTASYPWKGGSFYNVNGDSNGDLFGTPSWFSGTSGVNYSNSYLNFNSSTGGQYGEYGNFDKVLSEFTISVWINTNNAGNYSNNVLVVGQQYNGQADCNFAIRGNGVQGYQGFIKLNSTSSYTVDFGGSVPTNAWTNLVFTFGLDGGNYVLKSYVDSSLIDTNSSGPSGALNNNNLGTIIGGTDGGSGTGDNTFNGRINNVLIYDVALSSGQVTQLYNLYQPRFN